jgi:hypothetical protein
MMRQICDYDKSREPCRKNAVWVIVLPSRENYRRRRYYSCHGHVNSLLLQMYDLNRPQYDPDRGFSVLRLNW